MAFSLHPEAGRKLIAAVWARWISWKAGVFQVAEEFVFFQCHSVEWVTLYWVQISVVQVVDSERCRESDLREGERQAAKR